MIDPAMRTLLRHNFDAVSLVAARHCAALLAERVVAAYGLELPSPGRFVARDDLVMICTTLDQWLVFQDGDEGGLFNRLQSVVEETATLIDQSSSRAATVVSGAAARDALATLLPIDLHPRAMRGGRCGGHHCRASACAGKTDR